MSERDIVERLRDYTTCTDADVDEAAAEIERLRWKVLRRERHIDPWMLKTLRLHEAAKREAETGLEGETELNPGAHKGDAPCDSSSP